MRGPRPARPRWVRFAALLGLSAFCCAGAARAEDAPLRPFPEPEIKDGEDPGPLDRRVLKHAKLYEVGALSFHGVHDRDWKLGVFDVTTGQELRTHKYPFYLLSTRAASIRMYDDKSYGLAFFQDIGGGLALGPLEPEIHVGANLVELDVFHAGWNFSLVSPRASAELGVRVGRARVEIAAYTQYLWRWWGESYLVKGLSLGLQVDQPKMRVP